MSAMTKVLGSSNFGAIREVRLDTEVTEDLLKAVVRHQKLKNLDPKGNSIQGVSDNPELLAAVVVMMEEVSLKGRWREKLDNQAEVIFTAISDKKCKLKKLALSEIELASIKSELLSMAA